MTKRNLCVLWMVLCLAGLASAQTPKKPDPKAKTPVGKGVASKPAPPPPPPPVAKELEEETASIAKATGARLTASEHPVFDCASALTRDETSVVVDGAEKAWAIFKEISGASGPSEVFGVKKPLLVILPGAEAYKKLGYWYEKQFGRPGMGDAVANSTYFPFDSPRCLIGMHLKPSDATGLAHVAAHETGHLCVQRYKFNSNYSPPWLCEGMGAYLEARVFGVTNCYCFSPGGAQRYGAGDAGAVLEKLSDLQFAKWKVAVKAAAKARQFKSFANLVPLQLSELGAAEVGKAWSMIDYMTTLGPGKVGEFIGNVKKWWPPEVVYDHTPGKTAAQEKAILTTFGVETVAFEEQWRIWVTSKY